MSLGFVIKVESGISPSSRFSPRRGSYKCREGDSNPPICLLPSIWWLLALIDCAECPLPFFRVLITVCACRDDAIRISIGLASLPTVLILFILLQLRSDKKVPIYFIKFVITINGLCLHRRQTMRVSFWLVSDAKPHPRHSSLYIVGLAFCSASDFLLKSQFFRHIFQFLILDLPRNHPTDS